MFLYSAYGLTIESTFRLPELHGGSVPTTPDVMIRQGHVGEFRSNIEGRNHRADLKEIRFQYDSVGRFKVSAGSEVVVEPDPECDDDLLRACLLGPIIAALLHQRGYLVLHASAVLINGIATLFLGAKGWGKSTLAAFLQARGHTLLADDVVAVKISGSTKIQVLPGSPQLKLWPSAVAYLGLNLDGMPRLHPHLDKRSHRLDAESVKGPIALGRMYVLEVGDEVEIEPLKTQEGLIELVRHSYLIRFLGPSGTAGLHFRQCATVVSSIPIFYLKRPRSLMMMPEVARTLESTGSQETGEDRRQKLGVGG